MKIQQIVFELKYNRGEEHVISADLSRIHSEEALKENT